MGDRPDGDKAVLLLRMVFIEDFQIVHPERNSSCASSNEMPCFLWFSRFFSSSHSTSTLVKPSLRIRGRYKIEELVRDLPSDYEPKEEEWGQPVGREAW